MGGFTYTVLNRRPGGNCFKYILSHYFFLVKKRTGTYTSPSPNLTHIDIYISNLQINNFVRYR